MRYRRFGRTELLVSEIGFGALRIMGKDEAQSIQALQRALDLGINFFDTGYGYGDSEEKIGKAISHRRGEFFIATKSHMYHDPNKFLESVETSFRRMRTDKIELYQLHNVQSLESLEKILAPNSAYDVLLRLRDEGKIDFIGISTHVLEVAREAIISGKFDAIQVAYNLYDPRIEEEILPLAEKHDIGVIIMKPFAGGALVGNFDEEALRPEERVNVTPSQALRFCLQHPAVSTVIPGMETPAQVEECVRIAEEFSPLSEEEITHLKEEARKLGKQFCRECGYCMPCPQGIDIPAMWRLYVIWKRFTQDWSQLEYVIQEYKKMTPKADACTKCYMCQKRCPYQLDTPKMLEEFRERFGPKQENS